MEFRRSGSADVRRRRVLRDEITATAENSSENSATGASTAKRTSKRRYGDGAREENQPRITEFIPRRIYSVVLVGLLTLTAIAMVETAFISLAVRNTFKQAGPLDLFIPSARGSLAHWLGSMMLAAGGGLSYVTYRLRAYRADDFRGQYRLWLLVFVAHAVASLSLATGAHRACGYLMEILTGQPFLGSPDGWWLVVCTVPIATLAMRMVFDIRADRGALVCMAIATSLFGAAVLMTTGILGFRDPLEQQVSLSLVWLLGVWGTLLSQTLFTRYVFLDAQGLLKVAVKSTKTKATRKKKSASKSDSEEETGDDTGEEEEVEGDSVGSAGKKGSYERTLRGSSDHSSDEGKMSKSERKRLKKFQQTTRRAA